MFIRRILLSDISALQTPTSPFKQAAAVLSEITMGIKGRGDLKSWRWRWLRINFPRRSTTSFLDEGEIEGGSGLKCLCCVPLPVSGRRRRGSRVRQRKAWRNSRRKRRKLQRRLRNRPSWSVAVFFFFCFVVWHPSPPLTAVKAVTCGYAGHWGDQEGWLATGGSRVSIV